jgi:hypothetical protein
LPLDVFDIRLGHDDLIAAGGCYDDGVGYAPSCDFVVWLGDCHLSGWCVGEHLLDRLAETVEVDFSTLTIPGGIESHASDFGDPSGVLVLILAIVVSHFLGLVWG